MEFRLISGSYSKYGVILDNEISEERLFYLLMRKNKETDYKLIGTFPSLPELHSPGTVDMYNNMPVFETLTGEGENVKQLHYFNGERYIGEIRFVKIRDEKEYYKDKVLFLDKYGFEIISE